MKKLTVGILAHVDAGKTTLSEAMLYTGGSIRRLGRVDKGDAFLDTYELEKKRGITIFSKQAMVLWGDLQITLLDTPGHVDFSAEMERTLQVLDYAILVISGTDGVQGHTQTLWRLLARYRIPAFLFINKMDVAGDRKDVMLGELGERLTGNFVDFTQMDTEQFYESIAVCGEEAVLDNFLAAGRVEQMLIGELIEKRNVFPCFFGSALKNEGVDAFLEGMNAFTIQREYPADFGARVYKVTRDAQGNRLTHMKITGGCLKIRDVIEGEKVNQLRIYSGEKFETVNEVGAATICAVLGLSGTYPGQGLGIESASILPIMEPVLTCRIELPEELDAAAMLPKLVQLTEEVPELHIAWEESSKEIHAQIMGEIQIEIIKSMILERFGVSVEFGGRSIVYKETIKNTVEGVGHFEPLRHYAEVHLLLEPGEPGSGLSFSSDCSEDVLERSWQRLVFTHLEEKAHKGVLTGAAITDMRITLVSGRAHKKHTEGGDFRQAVYRAVRHGLMKAHSVLLEPVYDFCLEVPERLVGRAMSDVERMSGRFDAPLMEDGKAILTGSAPVACMDGYQKEVAAYSAGIGMLTCTLKGYGPCHNEEDVITAADYDPESDLEHTPGSVFCTHGAGFVVNWDEVEDYMHLERCVLPGIAGMAKEEDGLSAGAVAGRRSSAADSQTGSERVQQWIGTEEVDAILERTFYSNSNGKTDSDKNRRGGRKGVVRRTYTDGRNYGADGVVMAGGSDGQGLPGTIRPPAVRTYGKEEPREEYLLVDGYNIIFAWEELKELAAVNIDSARGKLLDILCNYQGIKGCNLIAVFDAYKVQGHATEYLDYHNIHVVYTKEAETADQYIEKFAHENGRKYNVTVATSDRLEQIIIRGQGCRLFSARDFEEEISRTGKTLREEYEAKRLKEEKGKRYLLDSVPREVIQQIREQDNTETGKKKSSK